MNTDLNKYYNMKTLKEKQLMQGKKQKTREQKTKVN